MLNIKNEKMRGKMFDALLRSRVLSIKEPNLCWLLAITATAIIFRFIVAWQPIYNHADEIWQYIEPAWGWITGRWVQTWEFHVGLRGWLIPMLFRPILAMGHELDPGGQGGLIGLRVFLAILALVIPYTFWRLGSAISPLHGLIAGWVGAIWPEIFFFASRPSGENLATIAIFTAILAIYAPPKTSTTSQAWSERARLAWIGLCLALGLLIRFQYAPAIGLLGLITLRKTPARCSPYFFMGGLFGLTLGGGADLAAGQPPLGWLMTNFTMNLSQNRSAFFGTNPWWWYFQQIGLTWSVGTIFFIPSIVVAAKRYPMLFAISIVTLLTHSLIPHKEYRFILLSQMLFIFLAAVGTLDLVRSAGKRWPATSTRLAMGLSVFWFFAAVLTAVTRPFVDNWGNGRGISKAMNVAGQDPGMCGIATYRAINHPSLSYALLGRDVPLLLIDGPQARTIAAKNAARFNTVFTGRTMGEELPQDYKLVSCQFSYKQPKDQIYCIFKRAGSCRGGAGDLDYNATLTRLGH